jgi:general secretion pathway protein A
LINIIADRALAAAYARESAYVTARMVNAAAGEVQPSEARVRPAYWPLAAAVGAIGLALAAGVLWLGSDALQQAPAETVARLAAGGAPNVAPGEAPGNSPQDTPAPARAAAVAPVAEPAVGTAGNSPQDTPAPALERLDPAWLERQHGSAWRALAGLWRDRGSAHAIQSACDGAARTGFACVRGQGNWSRIRHLGLPVLLVLQVEQPRLLVLRGFGDGTLLVGADEPPLDVTRDAVEEHWLGEYLVAWPQAPDWPAEIRRGESGAAVDIVMEMAERAEPAWIGGGEFNADFEGWLTAFQRRNGLKADGIIGPNTLIHLMAPTISEPRLVLDSGERS